MTTYINQDDNHQYAYETNQTAKPARKIAKVLRFPFMEWPTANHEFWGKKKKAS